MSETEYRTGKLKPLEMNGTVEEVCSRILKDAGLKRNEKYHESNEEAVNDELYEKYVIIDNLIYEVEEEDVDQYDDIFKMSKNDDGSLNFTIKYYNGSCHFREAIEIAKKRMDN